MTDTKQHLYHVIKDGKSGFINNKGHVVIDFEFDGASSFSEGFARIFVGGKVGFIDTTGNIVIQPKFDSALGFSEGFSVVTIGDKQGYINTQGDVAIRPSFYQADDFENGIARVMEDVVSKGSFIDKQGKVILNGRNFLVSKYSEGLINCSDKGNWGHINLEGHFVIPSIYKYTREFSEGKGAVSPKKDINGKPNRKDLYGFINKYNEMIIPPTLQGSDIHFSEGLCAVWDNGYGYIDDIGNLTIPYEFDLGQHFNDGLAVFKPKGKNKKYGYIDKSGHVIVEPIFTSADDFENGLASVIIGKEYEQYKYGFIDKKGNYIWEPTR
jgi:hypothetical protein